MMDESAVLAMQEGQAKAVEQVRTSVHDALKAGHGVAYIPSAFGQHDLEGYLPMRRRARGTMSTSNIEAFAKYSSDHAESGATAFINAEAMQATSVLNLGTPNAPGHCDNTAVLALEKTAAYAALLAITTNGARKQQAIVEFFEDWADCCEFFDEEGANIAPQHAISALRHLTIETARRAENKIGNLSAEASAFERVKASSAETIPVFINFRASPYLGLRSHTLRLRLAIHTPDDKAPTISLTVRNAEQARQDMAAEFVEAVSVEFASMPNDLPCVIGVYRTK